MKTLILVCLSLLLVGCGQPQTPTVVKPVPKSQYWFDKQRVADDRNGMLRLENKEAICYSYESTSSVSISCFPKPSNSLTNK